ncbi:MAG: flagellar export protein FliJ [Bacillota bacterium]|nr:flagellar export protein FliJ [Bacillota bacterium]
MKPFAFSLETKLKVARIEENQSREQVKQARVACKACEDALAEVEQRIKAVEKDMVANMQGLFKLEQVMLFNNYMPVLKSLWQDRRQDLDLANRQLEETQNLLLIKNRESKILMRLREKECEKYRIELNREEQKIVDEIAINRHFHSETQIR